MTDKPFPQQPQLHTVAQHRAAVLTYPGNLREAIRQAKEDPRKTLLGVAQGIPSVFLTKVGLLPAPTKSQNHKLTKFRSWPRQNPISYGWMLSTAYTTAQPSMSEHLHCMSLTWGNNEVLTWPSCIHAAQHHSEGKTMVVCRIPKHDEVSLTTALDAGAAGLVIPHTESAQDIRDKVREVFYRACPTPPRIMSPQSSHVAIC